MTFIYEKETNSAVDESAAVRIRMSSRFTDAYPVLPFELIYKGNIYDFDAAIRREKRSWSRSGKTREEFLDVEVIILERSVIWLHNKMSKDDSDIVDITKLREIIRDGMFSLCAHGGSYLQIVPDYKIRFVTNYDIKT